MIVEIGTGMILHDCKYKTKGTVNISKSISLSSSINIINDIQVQFHTFYPDASHRREKIQQELMKTHVLTYNYDFVWENWVKK